MHASEDCWGHASSHCHWNPLSGAVIVFLLWTHDKYPFIFKEKKEKHLHAWFFLNHQGKGYGSTISKFAVRIAHYALRGVICIFYFKFYCFLSLQRRFWLNYWGFYIFLFYIETIIWVRSQGLLLIITMFLIWLNGDWFCFPRKAFYMF